MKIEVKQASDAQLRAFHYLLDRDHGDLLENIAGVREAHDLTYQDVQELINHYCDHCLTEEERKYIFDFAYDMGVAQGILKTEERA